MPLTLGRAAESSGRNRGGQGRGTVGAGSEPSPRKSERHAVAETSRTGDEEKSSVVVRRISVFSNLLLSPSPCLSVWRVALGLKFGYFSRLADRCGMGK
jgi:hypothetical protein